MPIGRNSLALQHSNVDFQPFTFQIWPNGYFVDQKRCKNFSYDFSRKCYKI
jgi:hypothetical protein